MVAGDALFKSRDRGALSGRHEGVILDEASHSGQGRNTPVILGTPIAISAQGSVIVAAVMSRFPPAER